MSPRAIRMSAPVFPAIVIFCLLLLPGGPQGAASAAEARGTPDAFFGNELVIAELPGDEYSPAIAFNSYRNEYLVVWENIWPGGTHDIAARRVTEDGRLLSEFFVASSANNQMNPSVAYDPARDRYLVVFAYDISGDGSNWDIYGRFIPWDGPDPGVTDFAICDWTTAQRHPKVAYSNTPAEFLVTWTNAPAGQATYISARRVFAEGGFPGGPFLVSSGPEDRDFPDVTYNQVRSEYLLTWDMVDSSSALDVYGIRLSGTGGVLTGGNPPVLGEFPIAGWPSREEHPAVASCWDQFLVLWQSDQDTGGADYAIYGRYLSGDAVPGNVYLIADTPYPELYADTACNTSLSKYVIAWQDQSGSGVLGIRARVADRYETLEPDFEVAGPGATENRAAPAVAGGDTTFLTAWEHDRDGGGNVDIHGRLLGYFAYLPALMR